MGNNMDSQAQQAQQEARRLLLQTGLAGLVAALHGPLALAAAPSSDLLRASRSPGAVLLIRHAVTESGTGDPPEFQLGVCETQRNLSAEGRKQAVEIGTLLRTAGVPIFAVRTSQWCRCQETARLAFPDSEVLDWPALNSFFEDRSTRSQQLAEIRQKGRALYQSPPAAVEVWVTHQVVITGVAGVFAGSGEIVVAAPDADGAFTRLISQRTG